MTTHHEDYSYAKAFTHLGYSSALGSLLGSAAIVGLSMTITMWQDGLSLSNTHVGILSAALNFAIAIASMCSGQLSARLGMSRVFTWINAFTALGFLVCAVASNFAVLLCGVIIIGLGTGIDVPISISILSLESTDTAASSRLVTITQLGWQLGMILTAVVASMISGIRGADGARIVFAVMAVIAVITWLWRWKSKEFAMLHKKAGTNIIQVDTEDTTMGSKGDTSRSASVRNKSQLAIMFTSLLIFYIFWNLVANTWGQFQTFMLVHAQASQTLATQLGIVLYIIMFGANALVSVTINTRWRNILFVVGGLIAFASMVTMAVLGGSLWGIVLTTSCMYVGLPLAGEAICKVWIQESFPAGIRATVQGFILGFSRFLCGLFAFITPALVMPERIGSTLWAFVGVVAVFVIAGCVFMMAQRLSNLRKL
ncbi:MFS transporter [Alloscardovia theropitheci]|uniref:MFS transporter n=1 Tax=Alloscardovia theropitheci TaxID=2496842 RepID=A0A4V2MUB0_9BIFI|nr:MFS transporter [Alloscardovia theropitheci]TCD54229.1 MFS transporter [Alloscardovia theropitheci]